MSGRKYRDEPEMMRKLDIFKGLVFAKLEGAEREAATEATRTWLHAAIVDETLADATAAGFADSIVAFTANQMDWLVEQFARDFAAKRAQDEGISEEAALDALRRHLKDRLALEHVDELFECTVELIDIIDEGHVTDEEIREVARRLRLLQVGLRRDELHKWSLETAPARAARWVLHEACADDELAKAQPERAFYLLRGELEAELSLIAPKLDGIEPGTREADAALASLLEAYGDEGSKAARLIRDEQGEAEREKRWRIHSRPHRPLAWALWRCRVRERLEEEGARAQRKAAAAAPLVLLQSLTTAPSVVDIGPSGILMTPAGSTIIQVKATTMGIDAAREAVRHGLDSPAFWKLLAYFLECQRARYIETGDARSSSVLDFDSLTELTRLIGMASGQESKVREALNFGASLGADRGGEGWKGLWTVGGEIAPRHRGALRVSLSPVLHIDAASFMPKTSKLLAPIADPARMPKPTGDHRTYARQHAADQSLLCIAAERSHTAELDGDGLVFPFDVDRDRRHIASETGLYRRTHADLSAKWLDRFIEPLPSEMPPPVGRSRVLERADAKHLRVIDPGIRDLLAAQGRRRRRKSEKAIARLKAIEKKERES